MSAFINTDLVVDQNSDFTQTENYDPYGVLTDLTSYTASMMVRINKTDVSPLLTLTESDGITLGGVAGTVKIDITHARVNTLAAALPGGSAFYDLILVDGGGLITRFMQGAILIDLAVTR